MAGIPKVRIQFDADFDELKKGVKGASNEVEGFGSKVADFSKKAGAAFALAGAAAAAYAGKLLIDGVKSAIEDEAAQAKLATTLKNVAGATDVTVAATEAYILKMALATGIADDDLRPSFERLARATGDITKAQKLQTIAIDVAAGAGKSLEAVSNALGKAYEGSTGALGKLGLGIDAATLKSMTFDEITEKLASTFKDQASIQADTFAGKMARLTVGIDEAKESVGAALLPMLEKMASFITLNIVPAINSFVAGLTGDEDSLTSSLTKTQQAAFEWGKRITGLIKIVIGFKDQLIILGATLATIFTVSAISGWVLATVAGIRTLITAYNALKASAIVAGIATAFALNPLLGVGAVALAATVLSAGIALSNKYSTNLPGGLAEAASLGNNRLREQLNNGSSISPTGASFTPEAGAEAGGAGGGTIAAVSQKVSNSIAKLQAEVDLQKFATQSALDLANQKLLAIDRMVPSAFAAGSFFDPMSQKAPDFKVSPFLAQSPNISITVNGAIDKEGTARQIVEILNDSYYRGTLGAGALVS